MKRRAILIAVLLIGGIALVAVLRGWHDQDRQQRVEDAKLRLDADDPRQRIQAATELLEMDPTSDAARLELGQALLDTGQFREVRPALAPITDQASPQFIPARRLEAECYLAEARLLADRAAQDLERDPNRLPNERVLSQFDEMLRQADEAGRELAESNEHAADFQGLIAKALHTRTVMLQTRLRALARITDPYEPRDYQNNTQIQEAALQTAQVKDELIAAQDELRKACLRVIELEPENSQARALLFLLNLDRGELEGARVVAREMAELPELDGGAAGQVADALLQLEPRYAQERTGADLALVHGLIEHKHLERRWHLTLRLSQAELALQEGRYEETLKLVEALLEDYAGHPRAIAMQALANAALDHSDQAVTDLQVFMKRQNRADLRFALGTILMNAGRDELARQWLAEGLEMDPSNLTAYLAIAHSKERSGVIGTAEPEIRAALRLNPRHAQVQALRMRLLIAKLDRQELMAMLTDASLPQSYPLTPDDLVLAAAMVTDETEWVASAANTQLKADPSNPLWRIAEAWTRNNPQIRLDIAALVVNALDQRINADPLMEVDDPYLDPMVWHPRPENTGDALSTVVESVNVSGWSILNEHRFLPSVYYLASRLVDQGLELWPEDPGLQAAAARLRFWLSAYEAVPEKPTDLEIPPGSTLEHMVGLVTAVRAQDDAVIDEALAQLLEAHAWCEPAVMMVIADTIEHGREDRLRDIFALVAKKNEGLALLAEAKVDAARGRPTEAIAGLERLTFGAPRYSPRNRFAADTRARAQLALGNTETAVGILEGLGFAAPDATYAARVAVTDLYMSMQRETNAAAALAVLMGDVSIPTAWLDRVLIRAEAIMDPLHRINLMDTMPPDLASRPIVRLYRARALRAAQRHGQAQDVLQSQSRDIPNAPRVLLLQARVAVELEKPEEARAFYGKLLERGGRAAEIARTELQSLESGDGS